MRNRRKILLIDDEEDFCFFIKQNLEHSAKVLVDYAANPDRGIAMARKDPPDLIFLDVMMPGKDGIKIIEILKKDKKTMSIPIVMLTAVEDDATKLKAARYYCEDYLVKPVSRQRLEDKIDEVLNRQGQIRA